MDLHMSAERHAFHRAMFKGEASWQAYLEQTAQTLLVQDALERALRAGLGRSAALVAVVREHHFRAGMIREDLKACGVDPTSIAPLHATRAMLSTIERDAGGDPAALLGAMYVLEGSTNGAKFIKTALQRAYAKSDDTGLKWLDPHGEQLRERWHGFRGGVAGLQLDEATGALILSRARGAFAWTIGVMDELCARHGIEMKPGAEPAGAGGPGAR
jgi:heme oxygenase